MDKILLNPLFVKEELDKLKADNSNKIGYIGEAISTDHTQAAYNKHSSKLYKDIINGNDPAMECKGGGGGGTSTTTIVPAAPSPEERELQRKQNALIDEQINRQYIKTPDPKDPEKFTLELKPDLAKIDELSRQNILADQEVIDLARKQTLKFLKGDISITPEQRAQVEDVVQRTFVAPAERELSKFETEASQQLRESAARLGRGPLDPALVRDLTKEISERRADVLTRAGALRAGAEFELGTGAQFQRAQFGSELQRFQESLRQQATENRFGLIGALQNRIDTEQRRRQGAGTRTTTFSGGGGGGGGLLGGILGGAQFAMGAASLGFSIASCLVAEALYGKLAYETSIAREIVRNSKHWLAKLYTKYGYKIAPYFNKTPISKIIGKFIFNLFIRMVK